MARYKVIEIGLAGVDMLLNPLFLQERRAAFAKNIAFEEATIKTRPGFRYHDLGIKGQWQGGTYYSPSTGLSSMSYSNAPSALANVVGGSLYLNPITDEGIGEPINIGSVGSKENVFLYDAENYLVAHVENGSTLWSEGGIPLKCSPGIQECTDDESHDTFDQKKHRHWLPNQATVGAYIHGRIHISVPLGVCSPPSNSELLVSDLITKRGCLLSDDILKMEEHMNPSYGGGLSVPSRLGPTKALATLYTGSLNGEGELLDFRKGGIVRHNTLGVRETRYNADGTIVQEGWDTRRLTNVVLNTVGAVGRYAVTELPNDVMFRSQYGLHFYRRVLGEGTFNDETTNLISQDLEPLLKLDQYTDAIEGSSVGHWLFGDRFFATVGLRETDNTSSYSARGFVSFNQTYTYTEDRTPRMVAEGLWCPDCDLTDIHKFTQSSECPNGEEFGFIASDAEGNLYFAEMDLSLEGVDIRDGKEYPIKWEFVTGAFSFNGLDNLKEVKNGYIDAVLKQGSKNVKAYLKTDQHDCWEEWGDVDCNAGDKTLLNGYEFGSPNKSAREGTWFQIKLEGEGYVELRTLDIEVTKTVKKATGKGRCVSLCCEEIEYFNCNE